MASSWQVQAWRAKFARMTNAYAETLKRETDLHKVAKTDRPRLTTRLHGSLLPKHRDEPRT